MSGPKPTRDQGDLAEMLETLLDKGVVINADIAVSVGDTELLGVKLRAAVASFETAAEYGLEFPGGTDMDRVKRAADVDEFPAEGEGVSDVLLEDRDQLLDGESTDADPERANSRESGDAADAAASTSAPESVEPEPTDAPESVEPEPIDPPESVEPEPTDPPESVEPESTTDE
jgi:hypothetical protein